MNIKITSLITGLGLIAGSSLMAQTQKIKPHQHEATPDHRTCGILEHHEYLKQTRPNYEKEFNDYNAAVEKYLKDNKNAVSKTTANITIPVVVHVVYKTAAANISDARVIEQVNILNNDFQRLNADSVNTPAPFKLVAGGAPITFCLAQRDPNGNPTTGIVHKATTVTTFSTNDAVKFSAQGGDDAWDVSRYVNIWICDLGTTLLGYGEFPTTSLSNTYGLVLHYKYTGVTGATAPFNKGRTGTHEFGHCFNLRHIWGDNGQCGASDGITDTPPQKGGTANPAGCNYGVPTYPFQPNTCTRPDGVGGASVTNVNGDMFMNYMDYTDDAAMNMFSKKQCDVMYAVVTTPPYNVLQNSNGCQPVNLVANDAGIFNVTNPTGTLCAGSVQPVATLKNMGNTALTSCTINYKIDNGTVNTYPWTGNLASLATTNVTLPAVTVTAGTHTLTVYTSNPNNGTDGNATNDQATSTFTAIANAAGNSLPFTEGFEGTTFVPTGWTLNNPDAADTWARTTAAFKSGVASAKMDNYTNDFTGQLDEMVTPAINLASASSPQLTFQLAYKLYTSPTANPNYSDTLEVLISTDCGATYTSIYKKFGSALTTTTPAFAASAFTPTAAQWRMETVSLASYASAQSAYIKFRNISQYENNLYLDDINITGSVGINEYYNNSAAVNVYPNPSNGNLTIDIYNNVGGNVCEINIYNVIGQKVISTSSAKGITSSQAIDMSSLANGVYQVEVKSNNQSTFTKVVLNK